MKSLITVLSFLVLSAKVNGQNLIHIPVDAPTLSDAVQLAQDGDTIYLSPGVYSDSVHVVNKQLVFLGELGGESVLSPGENERSFVLLNSEVEFMHLTFDDFNLQSPPPNFAIDASYSDVLIEHCHFKGVFSPVSLLWGNLRMHSSIIANTRNGTCIAHNGGTFKIYNNLFYELTNTSILINRAHGEFFNNTMVGSTPDQYRGVIINSDSISHFFNNIITGFGVGIHLIASDSVEFDALRIDHNNIYNVTSPYWYEYNEDLSLPIYSGELTPNPGTGEISSIPNFTDPENHEYSLQAASPCIDAGVDSYSLPVMYDLAGNVRLVGTNPDMGAFEYFSPLSSTETAADNKAQIDFYPNPARDHVWIRFDGDFNGIIEILDSSGRIRQTLQVKNKSKLLVEMPFENGLYLIRVVGDTYSGTGRIIRL